VKRERENKEQKEICCTPRRTQRGGTRRGIASWIKPAGEMQLIIEVIDGL
jgi:hypothetical protein